eukprot:1199509-Rhodomonas_salina.2
MNAKEAGSDLRLRLFEAFLAPVLPNPLRSNTKQRPPPNTKFKPPPYGKQLSPSNAKHIGREILFQPPPPSTPTTLPSLNPLSFAL